MPTEPLGTVSAAIGSRRRLTRWFDNARKRRDAPRPTGRRRDAISEIMGSFQRDIMGGPDRRLVHRIPLPSAASAEETLYLFPGHRAIYEIRLLFGRRHHFITFIECDRDPEGIEPGGQDTAEANRRWMEEPAPAESTNDRKPAD